MQIVVSVVALLVMGVHHLSHPASASPTPSRRCGSPGPVIGLFNLLPILPFDGGNIVLAGLEGVFGKSARVVMLYVSFAITIVGSGSPVRAQHSPVRAMAMYAAIFPLLAQLQMLRALREPEHGMDAAAAGEAAAWREGDLSRMIPQPGAVAVVPGLPVPPPRRPRLGSGHAARRLRRHQPAAVVATRCRRRTHARVTRRAAPPATPDRQSIRRARARRHPAAPRRIRHCRSLRGRFVSPLGVADLRAGGRPQRGRARRSQHGHRLVARRRRASPTRRGSARRCAERPSSSSSPVVRQPPATSDRASPSTTCAASVFGAIKQYEVWISSSISAQSGAAVRRGPSPPNPLERGTAPGETGHRPATPAARHDRPSPSGCHLDPGKAKIFLRTRKLMSVPHVISSVASGNARAMRRIRSRFLAKVFAVAAISLAPRRRCHA